MSFPSPGREKRSFSILVAIGILKLVKSILLLGLGMGLVYWRDQDIGQVASHWIDALWVSHPFFDSFLAKLSLLHQRTLDEVAVGSFVYAGLLLVEGVGLCLRKRWAEYLTVAITASFLPFEFYELFRHLTLTRAVITFLNIAILWYLVIQLLASRRQH